MIRIFSILCVIVLFSCKRYDAAQEVITPKGKRYEICNDPNAKYNTIERLTDEQIKIAFRTNSKTPRNRRDTDKDGILDGNDNCPAIFNPDQIDSDKDGLGDACDNLDNDIDRDGIRNEADNCPSVFNPTQEDVDLDGIGDVCDIVPVTDTDLDGIPDALDNCPTVFNKDQSDIDGDGIGDGCDSTPISDTDNDGIMDSQDNCPTIKNTDQSDVDNDGIGDMCDIDFNNELQSKIVLFFDVDGHWDMSNLWTSAPLFYPESGLTEIELNNIFTEVKKDYAQFPIIITTDSVIFRQANPLKKARLVITKGNAITTGGGQAYIDAVGFTGDAMAGYINTTRLFYSQKRIAETCSHEAGHTLGLYHQSDWSDTCRFLQEYSSGLSAPIAPIMGNSYSKPGEWWIGKTPLNCTFIQNDSIIIRRKTGL
jgi:ferredoxin